MITNFSEASSKNITTPVLKTERPSLLDREVIREVLKAEHGRVKKLVERIQAHDEQITSPAISLWLNGKSNSSFVHLFASNFVTEILAVEARRGRRSKKEAANA